jgi:hypothetical protein
MGIDSRVLMAEADCVIRSQRQPPPAAPTSAPSSRPARGGPPATTTTTFVAFELCPFLLVKRLTLRAGGIGGGEESIAVVDSDYLGSFKAESRQSQQPQPVQNQQKQPVQQLQVEGGGGGEAGGGGRGAGAVVVVHVFEHPESGAKTVVEYVCDNNGGGNGGGGSVDEDEYSDFEVVLETRSLLHLRTTHALGCA